LSAPRQELRDFRRGSSRSVWAGKTVKWTVVAILGKAILDYILIRWANL